MRWRIKAINANGTRYTQQQQEILWIVRRTLPEITTCKKNTHMCTHTHANSQQREKKMNEILINAITRAKATETNCIWKLKKGREWKKYRAFLFVENSNYEVDRTLKRERKRKNEGKKLWEKTSKIDVLQWQTETRKHITIAGYIL